MNPAELLYSVETEILKSIVSSLGRGAVGSAEWQADRLRRLGIITEKSSKMVAAYRARVLAGFDDEVELSAIEAALEVDAKAAQAAKAGADVKDLLAAIKDPTLRATIATWQASARDQANLAMAQLAQNAGTVYSDIINRTALSVVAGAESGHKALVTTIREWSAQGIPSIVDKAGRQWTSEAYVNAVLRSNTSRAANESALARAEEYETDLVEVSSHPGSRPSHYDYQGQVYSRSGTNPNYQALSETGYGTAAGIGGVNCGHILYPFWEGVSIERGPTQTVAENEALYVESQNQRALERSIRSAKRELSVMESLGDADGIKAAKATIRDRQAQMREFIDETSRTRRYGREQVYDVKK
jgi:hypothetical protein